MSKKSYLVIFRSHAKGHLTAYAKYVDYFSLICRSIRFSKFDKNQFLYSQESKQSNETLN